MTFPRASLQGLPAELCNEIYALAFTYYDPAGNRIVVNRAAFKKHAKDYMRACAVSRKLYEDIMPVFHRAHAFQLAAVECDMPTSKHFDPETTLQYGHHQKWKSFTKQQFHMRLPLMRARKSIKNLTLRLLAPGSDQEIDPSWAWNHVIYSDVDCNFLWPLKRLHENGFTSLQSLKVVFLIKLYERRNGGGLWDRGFKTATERAIDQMALKVKPIIEYEGVKADIYDFPPSPLIPLRWIEDETSNMEPEIDPTLCE